MDRYEDLLKKAKKNLPQSIETSRFEIPRASVQVTGRLTYVKNFAEICKTLRRDPKHVAKYLFKELAVPGNATVAELILQGKFSAAMINKRIEDYVKEFVLCHECKRPDTNMVKIDKISFIKCEACGAKRAMQ